MWRYTHRNEDGTYPLVPAVAEISHKAEGYSAAHPEWGKGKVELSELESADVNESRKICTRFGLMWRKPNGNRIAEDERDSYSGATMCFHGAFGSPCYAPYPAHWIGPSGATPNLRKRGGKKRDRDDGGSGGNDGGSGGGKKKKGGGGGGGGGKKKKSLEKGQKKLDFSAAAIGGKA